MKQLTTAWKKDASTTYAGGIHIAFVMASNIDAEATNKCNGLFTNSKVMEDFMLGALGNRKVFLLKLHAGVQNLGIVKESHGRDTTWPLCIKHFIHMSAQVKLPVKKKIHWKGFIKLLSLHSIQMYNWLRNLTLEDVFLLDYSRKDTTFWDALWVACQDDSTHQLGLQHLPSGTDVCCHPGRPPKDRKSTRLNSSHQIISYAVFCLKKKKTKIERNKDSHTNSYYPSGLR